VCFTVVR